MAKVKSLSSSSSFYTNKPSFPELKFGLEIAGDCSPKCDFDISSLLSDNETHLEKQYGDNDNWNGEKTDKKIGRCSPLTSLNIPKFTNLGALDENHLKSNRMIPELNFDGDFSLSDLLSNDECSGIKSSKNTSLCESDNLFELCLLTEDDNLSVGKTSGIKNDISFDDLSVWMNSSISPAINSLKYSPSQSLFDGTKGKHKNTSSVSLQLGVKNTDCDVQVFDYLQNIDRKPESSNTISDVDLLSILGEVTIHDSDTTNSKVTTDNSETNCKKDESTDELSDDNDCLPDIDLTFCIKKSSKNDSSFYGNSPETVDSGFDESDFVRDKLPMPSDGKSFYKDSSLFQSSNKNIKVKQSLFFKAISAKHKTDDSKKSRLKNVMNELLKGSTFSFDNAQNIDSKESQRTIDHSNEHVIVSSYLKFGDEK